MEKCKYCQAELAENSTVCPVCGKDSRQPEVPETVSGEPIQEAAPQVSVEEPSQEQTVPAEEAEQPKEAPSAPIQEGAKMTPGKMAVAIAAVVVLVAALIGMILAGAKSSAPKEPLTTQPDVTQASATETEPAQEPTVEATVPPDGNPEDVTCKGSYSAADEDVIAAKDQVVARVGDRELTLGQLQVFYQMEFQGFLSNYGMYAAYFGLDYTKPLDTQKSMDERGITWQQLFLQNALLNWQQLEAMGLEAEKAGLEISREGSDALEGIDEMLQTLADNYGVTVEELLYQNFGAGAGVEEYRNFQEQYYRGSAYYDNVIAKLEPTQEELEEFYQAHKQEYTDGGVAEDSRFVNVRHILVTVKGGTTDDSGAVSYSDEEWETCRQDAQAILDEWLAGDATENSFAALATEKTEDPGSKETGGLYEKVYEGQMVPEFNDWCFDESRKYGDYDLVRTSYGYHVMFFVDSQLQWPVYAQSDWVQEQSNQIMSELLERYPIDVDYEKILLGTADFLE